MSTKPRGPTASTPGLLTTGVVGGWLTGSAFATLLVVAIMGTAAGMRGSGDLGLALNAGAIVLLAIALWVAGMICSVIGWFGLGSLHRSAALVAWLGIAVLSFAVLMPMLGGTLSSSGAEATFIIGALITIAYYVGQILFWARFGTARGLAMLALVGGVIAVLSGVALMLIALGDVRDLEGLLLVLVFAGPTGCVLAHIGSGLATGRERATVRALRSFD